MVFLFGEFGLVRLPYGQPNVKDADGGGGGGSGSGVRMLASFQNAARSPKAPKGGKGGSARSRRC